jgi:hypothetical protein
VPMADVLAEFVACADQCENLVTNTHQKDAAGNYILPFIDQKQITTAALLNLFVGWETFLESSLSQLMTGARTLSGALPNKYVSPPTVEHALKGNYWYNEVFRLWKS